ncbi:long-chain fatty acid transport protein 4-like isoform X2 [Panonychus citri]|nr:long-chain fatty acid transport protein 4-like isoform X2 [Panonychus citri]
MESRPEYAGIWIGLSKIGVITALVNPNLRSHSLAHSINILNIKAIIYDGNLSEAIKGTLSLIEKVSSKRFYVFGNQIGNGIKPIQIEPLIAEAVPHKLLSSHKSSIKDPCFYAYTSGTTGLPKAAIIKHLRVFYAAVGISFAAGVRSKDILYVPLPLYHMIGVFGATVPIVTRCTSVMRHKFSVSKYWDEFNRNKCTVAVYIGELCRFLLAQPPKSTDGQRKVRLVISTGLRGAIWPDFVNRFNVKRVVEFYGSTEGSSSLINFTGKVGAIGFLSMIVPKFLVRIFYPLTIIKVNVETGEPIRGEDGLCQNVGPGDVGMIIAKIKQNDHLYGFDGYVDREATRKKILADVLTRGDQYFVSGDLVTVDKYGYIYFKDRIGDTYRWRGENVATNEIEAMIARFCDNSDAAVFGVEIPGEEGKVGMAAIVDSSASLDLVKLINFLRSSLPNYALPHFVRLIKELQFTGTSKISKFDLKREGYNINLIKDPIYYLDTKSMVYKPLDKNTYEDMLNAHFRF